MKKQLKGYPVNAICMSLIIITAVLAEGPDPAKGLPSYRVQEIVSVRSMSEFECRLADYPYSKNARFRVKINTITPAPGFSVDQAKNHIVHRFKNADEIRLKNIRFRNYFRVSANVVVDGVDLAGELVANQMAQPLAKTPSTETTAPPVRHQTPPRTHRSIAEIRQRAYPGTRPVRRKVVTLESLLETKIDLSVINEDTTLEEALDILSDSVRPRLPLLVLWSDLEANAMIDRDTPIGLGGFGQIELKQALKLILLSISVTGGSKPELAYEGNVVTIGTQRGLLQRSANKVYSITDLTSSGYDEYGRTGNNGQDLSRILQGGSTNR
ncbi:MAG: hypothetical protein ACYTER_07650 [Planctomycetota bacterium]